MRRPGCSVGVGLGRDHWGSVSVLAAAALVALTMALSVPLSASADPDGVMAWGVNKEGELGNGEISTYSSVPVRTRGLSEVTAVAAGNYNSLARLADGHVMAWGWNPSGQLGDGSYAESDIPVEVKGLSDVLAIAGGSEHGLALVKYSTFNSGYVMAWGDNEDGQLGDGTYISSNVPVEVAADGNISFTAVAAGGTHSLALAYEHVFAWGENENGQLGDGTYRDSDVPVIVEGELNYVTAIAAGATNSLALLKDGHVMAWGDNEDGQLGNGTYTESDVPVEVTGLSEVTAIAANGSHCLALLKDGHVMAWGDNEDGQLGNGTYTESDVPVEVTGLSEVTAIAAGSTHSLARLANGHVMTWGANYYGQLGNESIYDSDVPVEVTGLSDVTAIAGGRAHSLAVSAPPPAVSALSVKSGPTTGGTLVTITGTNFTGAEKVEFGPGSGTITSVSETSITVKSPAGTGKVYVTVTTPGGTSPSFGKPAKHAKFTYKKAKT